VEAIKRDLPHRHIISGGHHFFSLSLGEQVPELCDLEALRRDYERAFSGNEQALVSIAAELERLSLRRFSDFLDFDDAEADLPAITDGRKHPAGEYLRTGLLLGYPLESTFALIDEVERDWWRWSQRQADCGE
jgi:hypothetical protein